MTSAPGIPTIDSMRAQPAPEFAQTSTDVIKQELVARFEEISGRTLFPAQVENFMIDLMAYALSNVASAIQNGITQNRAIWAEGSHLDQLGANVGTFRLPAQSARAEVEFGLAEVRGSDTAIPAGTRISAGGTLIFASDEEAVIPAGDLSVSVSVTAVESGAAFNGILHSQINDVLDPVAYVTYVKNSQTSAGGSDVEDDARFRERIINAFERVSRGGSRQGYIELVKAAHPDIVDVEVIRPQPGHINIYPLMISGIAPDPIDDAILEYLDPETKIPMGDYVTIHKVTSHEFPVSMNLKVAAGYIAGVQDAATALIQDRFAAWGRELGAQIAPSALVEDVRSIPGVLDAVGPEFPFTDLPGTHFATLGTLNVTVTEVANV